MKRLTLLTVFLAIALTQSLYGQLISNVDFDVIKLGIKDSSSKQYYPSLIQRFQQFDTTLTSYDYKLIYYGNIFSESYNPYGSSDNENIFFDLYKQKKFSEAISVGQEVIKENPVNIKILHRIMICYHNLNDKAAARKYAYMYFPLLEAIYDSGDGKAIKSAYVVIKVTDEYEILYDLELSSTMQSLVGETDILTIDTKNQNVKNGQKKIKELYFNVSKPFENLGQLFKKKE